MYDTEDFTQEKETENKALRTLPLNVTHQNLSRQNWTIRESTHTPITTLKVLASERKYFTYRPVLVQREDFTKYRPPWYNGTTCALEAEKYTSARGSKPWSRYEGGDLTSTRINGSQMRGLSDRRFPLGILL